MKRIFFLAIAMLQIISMSAKSYDNPDTLFVARDGTAEFRNIDDAIEVCRAFMDYHKVIFVKKGIYKEKLIIPTWLTNIEICGQDRDNTIITYDDHANIKMPGTDRGMGTFRTYTLQINGNNITLKNITVENNAARLGQAVALHTQGTRILFVNCRFLGNQDTIYTGGIETQLFFKDCYIEGTTDFIFGPSTAWFEGCTIKNKINSYVTAASTPQNVKYGYIFNNCKIIADPAAKKCYLGRPWRPYAHTLFMNCELGSHIRTEGWHNWGKTSNELTARYEEYNNTGEGAATQGRAAWSKQLTAKEAKKITVENVFGNTDWIKL
ncbi:MAG: pectinesterase family protein [Prevotellaceae bacterium]|nr:pectinesterase family protein [Prevotellaceae bacterium]